MFIHFGLYLIATIQIITGVSMFVSVKRERILGLPTLKGDFIVYRNMLTALWISVGVLYLVGAIDERVAFGAAVLAILNSIFEIIGYWNSKLPLSYKWLATLVMSVPAICCSIGLVP